VSGKIVKSVKAVLALSPPGLNVDSVELNLKLDRLTVLVGPNASGKTTVLQIIGYLLSSRLDPMNSSLGFALTRTLRPTGSIPEYIAGTLELGGKNIHSILIAPHILALSPSNLLQKIIDSLDLKPDFSRILFREIENDLLKYIRSIDIVDEKYKKIYEKEGGSELLLSPRVKSYLLLKNLIYEIFDKNVRIGVSDPFYGVVSLDEKALEDDTSRLLRYLLGIRKERIRIGYIINSSEKLEKIVLVGPIGSGAIVFKSSKEASTLDIASVMVFHPGFIFQAGVFEGLYSYYAKKGLPREEEALNLLRKYIRWVKGYEVLYRRLFLKSSGDGVRVSVYSLSDGYRVAVFMSLLYALSRGNTVFLIDTPEAFVHPDGLSLIADFIVGLVKEGNQVIVATQSIEFLERLLSSSKQHGVLEDTLVERIELTSDGVIRPAGIWSGEVSLNSIKDLGLDLRR